ncbi:MAG TPA: pyridoxamine 5'-phosphate oxidase [Candidatus Dormibacteraeota bacterium]|nr:pyridoxamine 5'-phosphate oxidase [Candidatus Dormibacteraeota bacterium]
MPLLEEEAPKEPYALFVRWYEEAEKAGAPQPDAMALATSGSDGPSVRMVLFKGIDDDGAFLFYTNYVSRKGRDLAKDPRAALVFFWFATRHQVRVSGKVKKLNKQASQEYFATRPRGAQLSALASRQSEVVPSRAALEKAVLELAAEHPNFVPLPADWGGYALKPDWIEFWEGREDRLHDRLRYVRAKGDAWRMERLAP